MPGRDDTIRDALAALAEAPALLIHGPPGIGKTSVAGAVARASGRPILAFSLAGAEDGDDALRALGDALGALPCGDEAAILEALFGLDGALVVADDVASDAALAAVERVVANIAEGRLLAVGETALGRPGLALGPLPASVLGDGSGNPLWARLSGALGVPLEESLAALGDDLALLAAFPCGLPRAAVPRLP
ncbi:MAG: AAA family ATPase, partial [Deltaproteobacteria bacterium]|nr:AAA family ATPase [Deltaproteobacteria bacterium]